MLVIAINFVRCYMVISARLLRLLEPALFRSGTERRESETSACRVGCVPLKLGRLTPMVCKCGGGEFWVCARCMYADTHHTHAFVDACRSLPALLPIPLVCAGRKLVILSTPEGTLSDSATR